jgi:hypothetical protein
LIQDVAKVVLNVAAGAARPVEVLKEGQQRRIRVMKYKAARGTSSLGPEENDSGGLMKFRKVVTIIFAIVCVAAVASSALAQETKPASANGGPSQPAAEPLSKKRLLKLLTLNDSTQPELIQIVGQKGVDFKATPSDERELHDAGASDELIVAVRANYRDGTSSSAPTQESSAAIVSNADAPSNSQTGPTPSSQAAVPPAQPAPNTAAAPPTQAAAPPAQPAPNTAAAPPPAAKKKSFLDKFNETMNTANAVRASQAGSAQTPAPTQTAPTQTAPTQTAPTQSAPTQSAPTQTAPTQTAPTQTAPTQTAPTQTAPTQPTTAPAEPTNTASPPPATTGTQPPPDTMNVPGIMASPNNIALVNGKGQGKTTLTWDAGADHPNAEVWVKIDDQDETKVVAQGKGTLQVAVVPFKTYVYTLKDAGKTLASVTVKFHRNEVPRKISEFAPIPSRDSFKGSNASQ